VTHLKYGVYGIELSPGPRYNQVQIDERCFVTFDVTLEQRIRELCAQAVAAQDTAELQPILAELRHALREHLEPRTAQEHGG
jgi:DNA-binding transcriptional regulator YbjK